MKLFDFGLARETNLGSGDTVESSNGMLYTMSGDAGSLRWMAPEVAAHQPYNRKVDIYSFGKCRKSTRQPVDQDVMLLEVVN